ncbi:hypothetical protein Q3G72_034143 [Acer saccharum]|nr:hypothetical protein Q3G72_034143 [Acer saccharum]
MEFEFRLLSMGVCKMPFPGISPELRELEILDLSNNSLSREIADGIESLVNISTMNLRKNSFTGGIPASVRNMSKLGTLQLDTNC